MKKALKFTFLQRFKRLITEFEMHRFAGQVQKTKEPAVFAEDDLVGIGNHVTSSAIWNN